MLLQLYFIKRILILTPLLLLVRGAVLLCSPGLRRRTTFLHECGVLAFWLYLTALCCITVNFVRILHGNFEMASNYNLTPFAEIKEIAAGGDKMYALLNIPGNVALFVPFGFLLPLLWRQWPGIGVFFASMLLSGGIETLQLFTGRSADIDDVILNTVGGVCGYTGFLIVKAVVPGFAAGFRLREKQVYASVRAGFLQEEPQQSQEPQRALPAGEEGQSRVRSEKRRRQERRKAYRRTALATTGVALCVFVSGAALLSGFALSSAVPGGAPPRLRRQPESAEPEVRLRLPELNSEHILLVSGDQILYAEEADRLIYPASMTKIMTAILVLEHMEGLQEFVFLREGIFTDIHKANLATAGFLPGEEAAAVDLIYGLMLPSGAECAVGLAEHIAGTEEAFAQLMNAKAGDLGMDSTHFVNATGLHHRDHYTTAADMVLLLRYALDNGTFRAIASTERYSTAPTNLHPEGITFYSTFLGKGEVALPEGGKTGYTDEAGQCLASFATVGGEEYILVTAGARPKDFRTEQLHIEDAQAVYAALR